MCRIAIDSVGLANFTVNKCIGKGAFGKVLLVSEFGNPEQVFALKVLRKDGSNAKQLASEERIMRTVSHPFVVKFCQSFETRTTHCLLMEFCGGGELFFHLTHSGCFDEPRCKFYIAELTLALKHLHSLGLVYGDLKPENVLLDSQGHVKLVDFGITKEGVFDNHSLTEFAGTPEYCAPEVLAGAGHGQGLDWYTLGALTFELLTGLPPFYSKNQAKVMQRIRAGRLTMPKHVSHDAENFILSLMKADPDSRLGGAAGGAEVQAHEFFTGMDFDALLACRVEPPFVPKLTEPADTTYVDSEFTSCKETVGTPSAKRAMANTIEALSSESLTAGSAVQCAVRPASEPSVFDALSGWLSLDWITELVTESMSLPLCTSVIPDQPLFIEAA